jgi:hypothetical protein
MRHVFVRFLGESSARTKTFRDYLTNELNLKTFISSLGAPDIYLTKYIHIFKSDQNGHQYNPSIAAPDA